MINKKELLVLTLFLVHFFGFGQYTDVINSNRPGESMSAFSVGKSVFQAEIGLDGVNEKHDILNYTANGYFTDIALRYGLYFEQLEIITNLKYQNDHYESNYESKTRSGFKKITFGGKYLIYDPFKNYTEKIDLYSWKKNHRFKWRQLLPSVSAFAGINLENANNPFISYPTNGLSPKVMIITQNQFRGAHVFVFNLFLDEIGSQNQSLGYVMTYTKGINEHWSAFIENKGIQGNYYSDGIFSFGAAYLFDKSMQVDASIGTNYKNTPSLFYGGIGFSWRFDKNYQEVKLKIKKEKKPSKQDKAKEKEKKRIDDVENGKKKP